MFEKHLIVIGIPFSLVKVRTVFESSEHLSGKWISQGDFSLLYVKKIHETNMRVKIMVIE